MKAWQEHTLADGIHVSRYFMCTKFDILNHDGFLISGVLQHRVFESEIRIAITMP